MKRAIALAVMALLCLVYLAGPAAGAKSAPKPLSSVILSSVGPGYSVVGQGPLSASDAAVAVPNPAVEATALGDLSARVAISTYERRWADVGGNNEVRVLLVRFDQDTAAEAYVTSVRQALQSGETVSSGAMPGVTGAFRTTYFARTSTQAGVGMAVVADVGTTVATLSFFSSNASSDVRPVTVSGARSITELQLAALKLVPPNVIMKVKPPASPAATATNPDLYWTIGAVLGAVLVIVGIVFLGIGRRRSRVVHVLRPPVEPKFGRQDVPVLLGLVAAWLFRPRSKH